MERVACSRACFFLQGVSGSVTQEGHILLIFRQDAFITVGAW